MKLVVCFLVAALLLFGATAQITWTCPTNSQPVTLASSYMTSIPTNISNAIPILFREGNTPHPALVSLQTPTSIKLTATSNISITFITQTSNFRNQLGYFIFNEGTQNLDTPPGLTLIWPDVTRNNINVTPKGCMVAGLTTRIGPFPSGTRVGFFMRQDGYLDASNYRLNNTIWWSINSTNLVNLDGFRHTSIVSIDGKIIVGFEDFTGMGDQDYNDVLFYATVEGGWDGTGIPVYNGEVVDTCLTGRVVKTRNYNCRGYGLLGTSNFQGCLGYISIPTGWSLASETESTGLVITNTKNFNWDRYTGQNICMTTSNGQGYYQNGTSCGILPIKTLASNSRCVYAPCERGILLIGPNVTNCQQTLSKCNVTNNNVIIGQSPATKANTSIVYPNSFSVLVSTVVNSKLPLSYDVWVPTKASVDVFVAIDLNFLSAANLDNIRSQLPALFNTISSNWNARLGFGTFWTNGTTLGVNPHLYLSNSLATISSVANSFQPPANFVNPGANSRVVEAYRSFAGNNTIGWRRTNCFGIVVVLTGRPMFNYTSRLMADMASWNNVPVFFPAVNTTTYNIYQRFINNLPIGYVGALTENYNNWISMTNEALNNYTVRVQFDPFFTSTPSWNELYWVRSDMPEVLYNPPLGAWTTRTVPLTYPGQYPVNDFGVIEIFNVNLIAWGYRSFGVAVNLNNPPRVLNLTYSFNEDSSFDFDLYGKVADPENNALTVQLLSLPGANGILTYQEETVSSTATIYDQGSLQFSIRSTPLNWNGQLVMTYQANDGCVNSNIGYITFNVQPVNDPPTSEDFSASTNEDVSVAINFATHIGDIDNTLSSLRIRIITGPSFGTLRDGATTVVNGAFLTGQSLTFVPGANFFGDVTFTYMAVDPSGDVSRLSTVTVTVNPIADPPTSTNYEFTTKMNTPVYFRLGGTSLDGNPINVIVVTLPAKGSLANLGTDITTTPTNVGLTTAHNFTFSPPVNQNGIPFTTFTFRVNDGLNSVSVYTVTLNVIGGSLINFPPTADDVSLVTPEDTDLLVNVTPLLSDGEDSIASLNVTVNTLPSFGTLWNGVTQLAVNSFVPSKTMTYRPNRNYNGPDAYTYKVNDSQFSDLGTVSITVTPINDAPTSTNLLFTTYEDTPITLKGFVVNDVDTNVNLITMKIISTVAKGELKFGETVLAADSVIPAPFTSWEFLYTPPTGLNSGDDSTVFTSFTFRVRDGSLDSTTLYRVDIVVIPVNDPPASEDIFLETLEDTPIMVTFNPRDVDHDPSTLVITVTSVLKGSFFLESTGNTSITSGSVIPNNGRTMWYFPDKDASSITEPLGVFIFQVTDPAGDNSQPYNGAIWVIPVNDPPVYKGLLDFTTYEDTPIEMSFGVDVVDIDSEGPFTLVITRTVGIGSLWECSTNDNNCNKVNIVSSPYTLVNSDLRVTFLALPDEFGLRYANFTFTVSDEESGTSGTYFVNINVLGVNDPPIIVPVFNTLPGRVDLDEDTSVILEWTVTDIDSPLETIVSSISVPIPASPGAQLYVCSSVDDSGFCAQPYGEQLTTPVAIPSLAPASYRVVFIPTPDQWDERNYAALTFTARDEHGGEARPVKAIIRVMPINDPPYIQANETVTITAPNDGDLPSFTFQEFSLGDPDARNKEITFIVAIPAEAGSLNVTYARAFEAIGSKPAACTDISNDTIIAITCSDPQSLLNELYFQSIVFQPFEGQMSTLISVFVDDLGNTDKFQRPLNASLDIKVQYSRDTGLIEENTTPDNTLTIALSVSAGAAVAGVAAAIALARKARAAQVDDFFEKLGDTFDKSNTSPIYQGDQLKQFNSPFYQPKTEAN
jgi:hypothetical protein